MTTHAANFRKVAEVFVAFLLLGLTSFGGPVAHLGYFREAFVVRRRWLDEQDYADLVALCQFLPGPASSQVGIGLGYGRAGYGGAVAAWAGFTLPSVGLLLVFAQGVRSFGTLAQSGVFHGLKIAAFAVVAQAVWAMGARLAPDRSRQVVAALAAIAMLLVPEAWLQIGILGIAALIGIVSGASPNAPAIDPPETSGDGHRRNSAVLLGLFVLLLAALPALSGLTGNPVLALADKFYRIGALVFGGGHVVLPLMQGEVVGPGLITPELFLAGYGVAQAVPGPLFSFSAFVGAMLDVPPNGLVGAAIALVSIYLPSFLLVLGTLPHWGRLRRIGRLRAGLDVANAAVVGLLMAALYNPVFVSAILRPADFAVAIAAFTALTAARMPPWLVVAGCAAAGLALGR